MVDGELAVSGFATLGGHNETAQIEIDSGPIDNEDSLSLMPVTPKLAELQQGGKHGDVFAIAAHALREAAK